MATPATEAKIDLAKAEAAAEKAYAAAAEQVVATPATKVEAPKAEAVKPAVVATPAPAKAAPAVAKQVAAPKAKPAVKKAAKAAPAKKVVKAAPAKKIIAKKTVKAAAKPVAAKSTTISQFKDTIMTKTKTTTEDFTAKIQTAVAEAQDKAKVAYEKGQALFGEAGEFTKGNVEALVASGKIVAAGVQDMGKAYVAEAKTAIETVQADFKELAAVKTPADFFKLQGEIARRNFDASVASASKHSEKAVKLANEAFAPISNRVSLAIEKVKQAA